MPKCKLALVKIMPLLQEMVAIQEHKVQVEFLLFDLFASLVRALNTLAKNHVIHCDIKPENIMLSPDGVDDSVDWCLIDLGCASKPHSPHDAGKTFCGTAPYFSPEAILRSENFYPRDIWAVGYLLNEIMNPSQCESASLYDCREARKKVLDEEEQKMQAPLFSEKDIPSELRFNSENERRDFFRYIQRSLVGQQFLQLVEAAKKGQSNFRVCFMYLINAMLNPIAESRPTAADLARLLPALETLLPSSRPEGYGKTILLEYFEMWSLAKEEKEKSGIYSLNSSGMFCASAGRHSPGDPPSLLGQTLRPLTANNEETKQALLSDSRLSF